MEKKGMMISIWVFVIAGIIMAALVFAGAFQNIQMLIVQLKNQQAVEEFNSIYTHAESVCAMTKGAKESDEISISKNIYAFYVSEAEGVPSDHAPDMIEDRESASGMYLCYQFNVEHDYGKFNCKKLSCETNMTYMGAPPKGSRLESIAKLSGDMYSYIVTFENTGKKTIEIAAKPTLN